MTVLDKLASALGRRDEIPNQLLAEQIARSKHKEAVKELVENLSNRDRRIQSDCIKVLYEIGERNPDLIVQSNCVQRMHRTPNEPLVLAAEQFSKYSAVTQRQGRLPISIRN